MDGGDVPVPTRATAPWGMLLTLTPGFRKDVRMCWTPRALAKCFGVGQMPRGDVGASGSQRDRGQAPVGFAVLVAAGAKSSSSER